jgi:hypothetical protein
LPWWWTVIVVMWKHVKSIRESAAFDKEKAVAPREWWFEPDLLESWYAGRREQSEKP